MAMKPKPKGWNAMSKAKQDAWKKANFNSSVKVTTAQLDKLRAEKTPEKAIAKYKNDPAMREALNRFYGKSRVGGSSSSTQPGGPGSKMGPRPSGGPGAKLGGDGRVKGSSKSSTATRTYGTRTQGKITVNAAADDKRKADFQRRTGTALAIGASLIPLGKGAMMAKGAYQGAVKAQARAKIDPKIVKSEFDAAYKAAKKEGFKNFGAKTAPKAAPKTKVTPKVTPKKTTPKATPKKTTPKVAPKKTAPVAPPKVPKKFPKKRVLIGGAVVGTALYPRKEERN